MALLTRRFVRPILAFSGLVGLSSFVGCSDNDDDGDDVCEGELVTQTAEDVDFSSYETFAIKEIDEESAAGGAGLPDDVLLNLEIANEEAAKQLEELGLEQVDPDETAPDLWVFSAGATEEKDGVYWDCVPGWYWWGWIYYWDPCAWLEPIPFEYNEGTFVVGVADGETLEPVFGGVAQGILECDYDVEGRITAAVDEIFDDYPIE